MDIFIEIEFLIKLNNCITNIMKENVNLRRILNVSRFMFVQHIKKIFPGKICTLIQHG